MKAACLEIQLQILSIKNTVNAFKYFFDLKELKLQVYYVFNMQLVFSTFHLFLGSPENTAKSNSSNSGSYEHNITFPQYKKATHFLHMVPMNKTL